MLVGNLNYVGNEPLQINPSKSAGEIEFGLSRRGASGTGRYDFTPKDRDLVNAKLAKATAVRVHGKRTSDSVGGTIRMLFSGFRVFDQFEPEVTTTATQVDRDIALVLDRSGSMLEYKNFPELRNEVYRLYYQGRISRYKRDYALTDIWRRSYPW